MSPLALLAVLVGAAALAEKIAASETAAAISNFEIGSLVI
jgi:hypothetical protein